MEKQTDAKQRSILSYIHILAWGCVVIGVIGALGHLVWWRFAPQTYGGGVSLIVLGIVTIVGILFVRAADRLWTHGGGGGAARSVSIRDDIRTLLMDIEHLSDDADAARKEIVKLGDQYRTIAEALARTPNAVPHQLDVQMALGDAMVASQRVWTTLADNAPAQAAAAWQTACEHARRIHTLLA